jgi:uncharacterized protein with NAD-binding domain and iron-sulfur cluster
MTGPIRVAVIGGGCAAIAAAFELTRPEHRGRYRVTIYQMGWRLGGKGASGRGPADRIEEHGLHVWMGWYENAFRLVRECYAELGRDPRTCPITSWLDAFEPAPLVGVADHLPDGRLGVWKALMPPTEGLPGDPPDPGRRWTARDYLIRTVVLLRGLFETLAADDGAPEYTIPPPLEPDAIRATIARFLRVGELASLVGLVQAAALLEALVRAPAEHPESLVARLLDAVASNARALLETRLASDPALRRVWHVIDLTLATLRGELRFGVLTDPRGFDVLDEYDCREWLLLNGASEEAVDSAFVRALYDLGFAYEDGDPRRPRTSAGQALRGVVRAFFTYRGAFFWRLRAGMGDVVFAPFYEVLRRRGVRFEFFHRLERLRLVEAAHLRPGELPYVEALEFDVQAEVAGGEYHPLVEVHGLPCWPARPDYGQLVDGARLEREGRDFESPWDRRRVRGRTFRVGEDFDLVVLGVGLGATPHVCRDLVARDPRWRAMVSHVRTVATQAFQLWLAADMADLGWREGPVILSGFVEPFETWADMRHLAERESWEERPRAIAYFCSVLPEPDGAAGHEDDALRLRETVRQSAVRFLNENIVHLWPDAIRAPGEFRWELLVDPDGGRDTLCRQGEDRFASQFWRANVHPSDRYTLSLPGTGAYRISPLDRTYDNLTIAGDWTDCGFNAGCVEAAVMSGRLAAHALAGAPRLEDIVGYDHP